ncbi:hypothetical protein EVJ50_09605 [Synechococcus sp. RSCCF101]|uniref:hypothetical protein n=1 Tax=Synechococcus sp. RSCCF101 TaxID=2511069 RepID=UPI001245E91C|nr:hypothetical protein [Synechococcus sp. RSCCF101]QEY32435.1 hypothetical protein EVJ50_09605 [Synechococcus sp. RSCCF101]
MSRASALRDDLGWWRRGWLREWLQGRVDPAEWQALAAYRGLLMQAFDQRPFHPELVPRLWLKGEWIPPAELKPFFSPSRRERDNASHHYGHDVQLKRHAGLPLVGRAMPFLLEHGLKVSREASFEAPRPWSRGYLCMGPLRAQWLRERHGLPAHAIGPWIHYARPVLDPEPLAELRRQLGPTLLVVLAHSWDLVERQNDLPAAIAGIREIVARSGYRRVIWLRHWKDPASLPLPEDWILACNGHRSNPWFLDAMRTLLELADGMASNAFGTHLGYAVHLGRGLHWLGSDAEQDLSGLTGPQAERERIEWQRRNALSDELAARLAEGDPEPVRQLLEPYWGFDHSRSPAALRGLLRSGRANG